MKILALESAAGSCSVALYLDGQIESATEDKRNSHTKTILPMVDGLLKKADCKLSTLNAIAYDAGPGSFTGLRIGAAATQGLAYGADLPVIKISSLSAMAFQSNVSKTAVALDARMGEVYFACEGVEQLLKPSDVCLPNTDSWHLVGNGWQQYHGQFSQIDEGRYSYDYTVMPHAKEIVQLAAQVRSDEYLTTYEALPIYIRKAV